MIVSLLNGLSDLKSIRNLRVRTEVFFVMLAKNKRKIVLKISATKWTLFGGGYDPWKKKNHAKFHTAIILNILKSELSHNGRMLTQANPPASI